MSEAAGQELENFEDETQLELFDPAEEFCLRDSYGEPYII